MKFRIIRICKSEAMSAVPQTPIRFDLERSSASLRTNGYEVDENPVMVIAKKGRCRDNVVHERKTAGDPSDRQGCGPRSWRKSSILIWS